MRNSFFTGSVQGCARGWESEAGWRGALFLNLGIDQQRGHKFESGIAFASEGAGTGARNSARGDGYIGEAASMRAIASAMVTSNSENRDRP